MRTRALLSATSLSVLLACLLVAASVGAITPVVVQTVGLNCMGGSNFACTVAGIYGDGLYLDILVTSSSDGSPVDNLGDNLNALPPGWILRGAIASCSNPNSNANITFFHLDKGLYRIVIVSMSNPCFFDFRSEYHYAIEISKSVSGTVYQGSGLGIF